MTDTPRSKPAANAEAPRAEAKEAARRVREADALRANLRRRKEQVRARAGAAATALDTPEPPAPGGSGPVRPG